MTAEPRYDDVVSELLRALPELSGSYESERQWWGAEVPSPHIVFGNVLNPYVDRLLDKADEVSLGRVFSFLERLAIASDARTQEVVAVTVCEHLVAHPERLDLARRFMGPSTLTISLEVQEFWEGRR